VNQVAVNTTVLSAITVEDGMYDHFYMHQHLAEDDIGCANADAPALIAAIAQVASVTIEQISQAMGVQVPQASAWVPVSERLPDTDGAYLVPWIGDADDGCQ